MTALDQGGEVPQHPEVPTDEALAEKQQAYQAEVDKMFAFKNPDGTPFTPEQVDAALDGYRGELSENMADTLAGMLHDQETTGIMVPPDREDVGRDLYLSYRIAREGYRQNQQVVAEAEGYAAFDSVMRKNHWDRETGMKELLGLPAAEENSGPDQVQSRDRTQEPPKTTPDEGPTGQ
jgi:hypothetical protein